MPKFDEQGLMAMKQREAMMMAMAKPYGSSVVATYADDTIPMKTVKSLLEDSAALKVLADEYDHHGIDRPEWLTEKLKKLAREVKAAHRREQEEKLARLEAEVKELRSKEEKRAAAEEEIARLKQELA